MSFEIPSSDEDLYTCCWLQLPPNQLCVAAAGKGRTIWVVDVGSKKLTQVFLLLIQYN